MSTLKKSIHVFHLIFYNCLKTDYQNLETLNNHKILFYTLWNLKLIAHKTSSFLNVRLCWCHKITNYGARREKNFFHSLTEVHKSTFDTRTVPRNCKSLTLKVKTRTCFFITQKSSNIFRVFFLLQIIYFEIGKKYFWSGCIKNLLSF